MKTAARNSIQNGTPNSLVNRGNESFFGVQAKLTVGKANDKYEIEADRVADKVVAKSNQKDSFFGDTTFFPSKKQAAIQKVPFEEVQAKEELGENEIQKMPFEEVQKKPEPISNIQESPVKEEELQEKEEEEEGEETVPIATKELTLQRKETGTPSVSQNIESRIHSASNSGRALENGVKNSMERSFETDFSNVQIHTDEESAKLNNQLSARAFTYKNNIFFGRGQYQPESTSGKHLLAHELTHVVQQGHAIQKKEAISTQTSEGTVQRLGISDALDHFANAANALPGFRMFTIFLGINPINMSSVERSAANIMRAIVEFLPGGFLITQVLDKYNVFTEAADLMKDTLDSLSITGDSIKEGIDNFLDSLSWSDIFDLGGVWERAKNMILAPINQLIELGKSTVSAIYEIVKKAILSPLASLAEGTAGYDLLKAVLGEDPITGDPYPPTAENLIGGFMKLIGQEEIWQNIQKGGAIGQAYTWFQEALSGLKAIVMGIPGIVISTITSLTWDDLIILPNAFIKVGKAFLNIAGQFTSWALGTTIDLLKILFSVVAPGVMPYIAKAGAAFNTILENPIGFVGNLVTAAKTGFQQFAANIGKHLKASLLNWLLGSLEGAGVYLPQELSFKEILKFVASVLGLTWENLRIKLVKHLGEPAVKALEAGFEIIQILITEGPAAAWEKIMEHLSNLQSMIISEISQFVIVQVVQTAIAKLVTSLNPAGAVIQAIIAIYQTITFLIDKIKQIAQVGAAIIDSIAAIANGVITAAANKVEQTLAGMLTLAVNFLAKFAGLGKISDAIINIINKIRAPIDTAMDKVVEWIVSKGKAVLKKLLGKGDKDEKEKDIPDGQPGDGEVGSVVPFGGGHSLWVKVNGEAVEIFSASTRMPVVSRIGEWTKQTREMKDGENKTKLLGLLSQATSKLSETEKNALSTVKEMNDGSPDQAKIDQNDSATETSELSLSQILEQIYTLLENEDGEQLNPMPVDFGSPPKTHDRAEYFSQLKGQEAGINAMDVDTWLTNRDTYSKSGRQASGDAAQAQYRAAVVNTIIVIKMSEDPTMTRSAAQTWAKDYMDTQAALHDPDQIAGGDPLGIAKGKHDSIAGLGSRRINSSIGARWKSRAGALEGLVKSQTGSMSTKKKKKTKMNSVLNLG
ncbi:MAG: DUF4157 domain-containing protein [Flavobacteriaceae bacterium]